MLYGPYFIEGRPTAPKVTYEVYAWWLEERQRDARFEAQDYRINPTLASVNGGMELFFTDVHPLRDVADVESCVGVVSARTSSRLATRTRRRKLSGMYKVCVRRAPPSTHGRPSVFILRDGRPAIHHSLRLAESLDALGTILHKPVRTAARASHREQ